MLFSKRAALMLLIILVLGAVGSASAASGGSFVFDYAGDAGDNGDGPQFDITLSGPIDDGGICDWVVMVMFDANGVVVDVDPNCVNPGTGLGSDDGDYGVTNVPTSRPITYTLFDVDGAEATALSGITEGSPAYIAYLQANGTCLAEDYEDASSILTGLPSGSRYVVCGAAASGDVCNLVIPVGAVVGSAPLGAQVYYSPGNITNITLNPGTYIVVGQDSTETYYKVVLACQFLWVLKNTMEPSFLPPQNGAPLPTTIVN